MRFQTTRELLDKLRYFHQQASRYYHQLAEDSHDQERVKLLLDYLATHEEKLADATEQYENDMTVGLADTWFDDAPELKLTDALQTLMRSPREVGAPSLGSTFADVDDVLRLGLLLDDYLILSLENLAQQAESSESREAFCNLSMMVQADKRKLVRDTLGLQGL